MKKILYIASEPAPGMIPFAVSIINSIAKYTDYEVHCVCVSSNKMGYEGKICPKAHPCHIKMSNNTLVKAFSKIWPIQVISAINQKRKQVKPDIVHFLTGDFSLSLYIRFFADESFYYTVHDLYPHEINFQCNKDKIIHKIIVNGYERCRDAINNLTTSSNNQLEDLKQMYKGKRIIFTNFPTLVNDNIKKGYTKVPEIKGVNKYILFFGSVNRYKGVDILVKAFLSIEKNMIQNWLLQVRV